LGKFNINSDIQILIVSEIFKILNKSSESEDSVHLDVNNLFLYHYLKIQCFYWIYHKDSPNRSETASASELSQQLKDALELLHQQLNFTGAFERCARWVYRRRN